MLAGDVFYSLLSITPWMRCFVDVYPLSLHVLQDRWDKSYARGISGGKQVIKSRPSLFILSKRGDDFIVMQNIFMYIEFWQDLRHYCLPWGHLRSPLHAKKVTMITFTHILTLSSLRWKGLHFLLSRINKLDRDFFHWQFFSFVPWETTWHCFYPISP